MTVLVSYEAVPELATRSEPVSDRWASPALGASGKLARRLQRIYQQEMERYKALLPDAERANIGGPLGPPARQLASAYPSAHLTLDGVEVELPIDPELYTNLFDLYAEYGWPGIKAAQKSLSEQFTPADRVVGAAWRFFLFTRNLLVLLIRETLIELEAEAARLIFDRLGKVNRTLSAALLGDLAADYTPAVKVSTVDQVADSIPEAWKLRKRAIAVSVFADMKIAVERRADLEELVTEGGDLAGQRREADAAAANEEAQRGRSPDPSAGSAARRRNAIDSLQRENMAKIAKSLRDLDAAQKQLIGNMPFAAVVLPGLRKGFEKQDMETALVKAVRELAAGVDTIAAATRPEDSRVKALMPGLPERWQNDTTQTLPLDPDAITLLYPPGYGLEFDLIDAAVARSGGDAAVSWLIEPRTWGYVRATGIVDPGSFADIVLHQWVQAIVRREREQVAGRERRTRILRLGAASLGLMMLVFPPLTVAAVAAGVVVIADGAYTAARELAAIDDGVRGLLPALDDAGLDALAEIGLLCAQRPQIIAAMTTEALILLATLSVQNLRLVGGLLVAKGFYDDSRTLIETVDEG